MAIRFPWSRASVNNNTPPPQVDVRAVVAAIDSQKDFYETFNDRRITFNGDLKNYDYDAILRDKEGHINDIYMLSDYFVDKDPIYRGIIKEVYTPFSLEGGYRLVGVSDKTKAKYEKYYHDIRFDKVMWSIFYQFYKYANVFVYLMEDGSIITLPVHKCRVGNVTKNGEPMIEFDAESVRRDFIQRGILAEKDFLKDEELKVRLYGFPSEVIKAIKRGEQWVQLNPDRAFAFQDVKEDWMRYAYPILVSCLDAFARKALIQAYDTAILNLGCIGFVHAKYGDPDNKVIPNIEQLSKVNDVFKRAMSSTALATTNNWAEAKFIQADTKDLFEYDKYRDVNNDILSAGGISGIIVSGHAEDGSTFASAQVSMQTAAMRIKQARESFAHMMDKINERLNGGPVSRSLGSKIPKFIFPPIDLSGSAKFQETCYKLWKDGSVSTKTMLDVHGYDYDQEVARKKIDQLKSPSDINEETDNNSNDIDDTDVKIGRPEMDDTERTSDPAKALTGKQPKPSNPDGSL